MNRTQWSRAAFSVIVVAAAVTTVLLGPASPSQAATRHSSDSISSSLTGGLGRTYTIPAGSATSPSSHVAAQAGAFAPMTVNCGNAYFGNDGHQDFFHVACSPIAPTTKWQARVTCSNGLSYYSGIYTSFQDVSVYCPAGTSAVSGAVLYA